MVSALLLDVRVYAVSTIPRVPAGGTGVFVKVLCLSDGEVSPHLTDLIKWSWVPKGCVEKILGIVKKELLWIGGVCCGYQVGAHHPWSKCQPLHI